MQQNGGAASGGLFLSWWELKHRTELENWHWNVVLVSRICWAVGSVVQQCCGRREGCGAFQYTRTSVCMLSIFLSCVHSQLWLVPIPSIHSITLTIISTPAASLLQLAAISITRSARGRWAHPCPIQTGPIPQVRYKRPGRFWLLWNNEWNVEIESWNGVWSASAGAGPTQLVHFFLLLYLFVLNENTVVRFLDGSCSFT